MAADLAGAHQKTLGADKNYDTKSINARWGIKKVFGWLKAFGGLRQFKVRGRENVSAVHSFGEALGSGLHVIAYNLIRLGNLLLAQPSPQE